MKSPPTRKTTRQLREENAELSHRLQEAEEALAAIRQGEVDALVIHDGDAPRVFTLDTADRPYRLLVENMQQAALTLQPDGTILYCNGRLPGLLELPSEKLLGARLTDFIVAEERAAFEASLNVAAAGTVERECGFLKASGEVLPAYLTIHSLPSDGPASLCALITDLTAARLAEERRQASEALAARMAEVEKANSELSRARLATLNLMADVATANEAMRQAWAELHETYAQSPVGMLQLDTELRYVRINQSLAAMNGLPPEAHIGRTLAEVTPELAPKLEPEFRRMLETGEPKVGVELTGQTAADPGVDHTWLESWYPLRDTNGRVIGLNVIAQDITENKRRERNRALLSEISEQLAGLLKINEVIERLAEKIGLHFGAKHCMLTETQDFETMTAMGWSAAGQPSLNGTYRTRDYLSKEQLAASHAGQVTVVSDTQNDLRVNAANHMALGIRAFIIIPLLRDGAWRFMLAILTDQPRAWTGDEVDLLQEIATRIWTRLERARTETALRESEERFRLLVERSPFGTYVVDAELRIVQMNQSGQSGAFRNSQPVIGSSLVEAMHIQWPEPVAEEVLRLFRHTLTTGESYRSTDFRNTRADDGRTEAYEWELHQITLSDGQQGVLCYYYDSTKLRDAELAVREARDRAEAASRAKDDFLAALSHELRTPLNPVLLSASEMAQDPALSEEMRNNMAMIQRNIQLEARLIDDLLDLTRISRGLLLIARVPADTHLLLRHVEEIVRGDSAAARVGLSFALEAVEHHTLGDPARLQQVFWNLIKNAIKFSDGIGSVSVRTFNPAPGQLAITVADTGIGISAEALPRIFKPFEQAEPRGQHRFGGLGLGLAISKAIVDLHDGTLQVQSDGPGRGATFTVELDTAPAPVPKAPRVRLEQPGLTALQLLVVEDHETTLSILKRQLERGGHRVHTATSVKEALAHAEESEFDLVISDLGLPDGTGLDLMRILRARHGLRGIALSGYGTPEDLRGSHDAGFVTHLVKPVDVEELRRAMRTAMQV